MAIAPTARAKTRKVLFSFIGMFLLGIGVVILAMIAAAILNASYPLSPSSIKALEYLGYAGWCATLGMRGWDIQTWGGTSFPERLNGWLAKFFSIVGIFAFVLAKELVAKV